MLFEARPSSRTPARNAFLCVTDKLLHALLKGHGMQHRRSPGLAHSSKTQRLQPQRICKHRLQGARLPYSPHKLAFTNAWISMETKGCTRIMYGNQRLDRSPRRRQCLRELFHCAKMIHGSHSRLMRQPARVLFHCAKIMYRGQRKHHNPCTGDSLGNPRGKAVHEGWEAQGFRNVQKSEAREYQKPPSIGATMRPSPSSHAAASALPA